MKGLSKSRYTTFCQCPKNLWLKIYLIRDLCKRFGIPENEEDGLGLYVPQRALMKVLVGSDTEYYRGNILYLNREAPDRLVITSEADNGDPLLYALRQAYTNLDIEIKETEW